MKFTTFALALVCCLSLAVTACAKITKTPNQVITPASTKTKHAVTSGWKNPIPANAWSGDKKVWAQVPDKSGKLHWVSFQNAPARTKQVAKKKAAGQNIPCNGEGWKFSVAWRTDKTSHPGEKDAQYGHVGIRCYGNDDQPCPPTQGEAWQNIVNLISGPMPKIPENWQPNMVYGPWLGSCN